MSKRSDVSVAVGMLKISVLTSFSLVLGCRLLSDTPSQEAVIRALTSGAYSQAEALATALTARSESYEGPESLAVARALDGLVQARLKNGRAGAKETLELAQRAVRLKERHLGPRHLETVVSSHNLGVTHVLRGEFSAGLRRYEDALAVRVQSLGPNDPLVADTLDEFGLALIQLERFPEAEQKLTESQRIREQTSIESPVALARTLELIGLLYRFTGNYSLAEAAVSRAFKIRSGVTAEHPDIVFALQIEGDIKLLQGDVVGAQRTWSSALQLAQKTLRPDHPWIADALRKLGLTELALGNLAEARRLRQQALSMGERSLAPCDPLQVTFMNGVAISLQLEGDFSEARRLYQRAISTTEKCIGTTTAAYATLLFNQAELAALVGDLIEADRLHRQAVEIWSQGLGPDHPFVARGLEALAEVASSRGEIDQAYALYEKALAIRRRSLGEKHPHVAWTLTSLAGTIAEMGNLSRAIRYVEQAIAIYRESGASDEPDHFSRVLQLKGMLEERRGNLRAAQVSLERAIVERIRIFGENHPLVAETRAARARIDLARGDSAAALATALEVERIGREHLVSTARYLPEREAVIYAAKRPRGLDLAMTIANNQPASDPSIVFDSVVRSRGLVLDEFASRQRAASSSNPEIAARLAAAGRSRQRFANLVVRSLQEPVSRQLLEDARKEKDEAERQLGEISAEERTEKMRLSAGLNEVRRAMPSGTALVSFVRFEPIPASPPRFRRFQSEASYAAFVARSGSERIAIVPLGKAAAVDADIDTWHREASGQSIEAVSAAQAQRRYIATAMRLRRRVWNPLTPYLSGATRVFVVPDGSLNLVNLAALPDGNGYLAEREPVIHYLTTERDLLLPPRDSRASRGLLTVGGPAFDDAPLARSTSVKRSIDCQALVSVRFDTLPGSLSEVDEIAKLWPRTNSDDVVLLSGTAATETAVKRAVTGRRVVHLATHGFVLGRECESTPAGARAVGGLLPGSPAARSVVQENPLLLTGLAFAGANRRAAAAPDQDEGILTAEEIAGLNLQGTEWAVLSACNTGLGEVRAGEGVFGLRRAFQIAGARTVIMSLWPVEDGSTREWMRALYEGRLRQNLDTAQAVRAASLAVLRARRALGQSTHPFYWSAFVAAGDWR